ncbi:Serine-aspartate repeat-containing protein D [Nymphon striatum]|nr:Serine-aspartate repeat-containing protein D [Nymphon striatum]
MKFLTKVTSFFSSAKKGKLKTLLLLSTLLVSTSSYAVDITLDNTLAEISGDLNTSTCLVGDIYRLGTTATYGGQALDLLVEVTAEDNEFDELGSSIPCITVASGILETSLRDRDAGDDLAYIDLKISVVYKNTNTPLEVDRIVFSGFDLDSSTSGTGTDDVYMISPSRGYVDSGVSNVSYSEGAYGAGYDVKLKGQNTGNCNDSAASPDPTCRGGGISVTGLGGPNKVTDINIRVSNDNAYGQSTSTTARRLIQLSFKEVDFNALLASSVDHGDIPSSNYLDASHNVSVFTVLGYGEPADSENAQYSTDADSDDSDPSGQNFDDEDGVRIDGQEAVGSLLGMTVGRTHVVGVTTIGSGYLSAWLDLNGDGDFSDSGEKILSDSSLSSTVAIDTDITLNIPTSNYTGVSYARFRFSQNTGVGSSGSGGIGEVEDYKVIFNPGGNIVGHLYTDSNGNGTQDLGEPDLANVDVIITDSVGAETTVQTDGNGDYRAVGIRPGTASVNIDETDPDYPTGASQTEGTDPTNMTVNADVDNTEEDNGFFVPGTVSGSVKDDSSNGISGVAVAIKDGSGNTINDTNGNPLTTTTNGSGNYTFNNVPAGDYEIVEVDPASYASISDGDTSSDGDTNANSNTNDNKIPVTITSGKNDSNNDFVDSLNNPSYTMAKTSDTASISAPGTITYTFAFVNTGNVGLTNLTVADANIDSGTLSGCPIATLAVGANASCTATRAISQTQIDAGTTITNTATPSATGPDGTTPVAEDNTPNDNSTSTSVASNPDYTMKKTSDTASISAPGTITYTFAFVNTGNVALTNLTVADANIDSGTLSGCPIANLAVGANASCTGTRAISQTQIDAGTALTNTATPSATGPDGTTPVTEDDTPNDNSTSTSVTSNPDYTMAKTSDTASISAPGTITYTFAFVNTGNVALTNLTVADANIDSGTLSGCPIANLAVGANASCTATRAISQTQIDAGTALTNTATPSATGPDGTTPVTEDDTPNDNSTSTSVASNPDYTMAKTSDTASISAPGTITYTFAFVNTGNVALTNLTVADANIDSGTLSGCPIANLAVGANASCTATRAISQTQIDAGTALTNTATPSATGPDGTTPVTEDDTPNDNSTSTSVTSNPDYTMAKTSDTASISAPGTITYTFAFVNTGNVALTNLTVADANIDSGTLSGCPIATLAVGANASCTATRAISQTQIDAGTALTNTAIPSATGPDGTTPVTEDDTPNDNSTSTSVASNPDYTMAKTSDTASISAPGTITYTFAFVNTGNVALTNLTVADANIDSGTLSGCPIANLAVGANASCTATRAISQTQIDAGTTLTNTATPSATGPDGTTPVTEDDTPNDNSTSTLVTSNPDYTMKKTSDTASISAPGTITYTFDFVNTGNVGLTNLTVADANIDSGTLSGCPIATLAVGANASCTATRAISQTQIDAGTTITNTATPSATGPDGTTPVTEDDTPDDNSTSTSVASNPDYTMKKTSDTASISAPGTITYTFAFVNTGNVGLTNLTVADANIDSGTLSGCPIANLAVGANANCTATRAISQTQIDAGTTITNTATPSATGPDGTTPVTEDDTPNDNSTSTSVLSNPSYTMKKTSDMASISAPGTITYTFAFVNTGNVALTNLTVADANIDSGTLSGCPIATLAVGANASCTATRAISQTQIDAGAALNNTATPSATGPDGTSPITEDDTPNDNSTSTSVASNPDYTMAKTSDTVSMNAPGTITYTFAFVNTGNVGLTNLTVADANIDSGTLSGCPIANLAVGANASCTATRAISQLQIDAGTTITNTATPSATGSDGTTPVTEDDSPNDNSTSTGVSTSPKYTMKKTSDTLSMSSAGTITYSFLFTNTGNVALTNLTVADANIDSGTLSGCPIATLAVGANATCTATRAISQAQVDAGPDIVNTATSSATGPDGTTPVPEDDTDNDNSTSTDTLQSPTAIDDTEHNPGVPSPTNPTILPAVGGNDSDPDGTIDPATVDLDTATAGIQTSLTNGDGTWNVDNLGNVTFTPNATLTGNPAPITYTVNDNDGNTSNTATLTVTYGQAPTAMNDTESNTGVPSPTNPTILPTVGGNDSDPDGTIDPATVDLDPATAGIQTTLTNAEGTWTVDGTGNVTFTPNATLTGNPAPIPYTVNDNDGNTSNTATLTVTYGNAPTAIDDSKHNPGVPSPTNPTVLDTIGGNDTDPDGTIDPATVDLDTATAGIQTTFTNSDGTYSVDALGNVTFTPAATLTGNPTPITYTVNDNDGNTSNEATLTLTYGIAPTAVNDAQHNPGIPAPSNPTILATVGSNDTDPDGTIDPATVDLDPATAGIQTTLTNAEGTWTVDGTGNVTFTPNVTLTGNPSADSIHTVNDEKHNPGVPSPTNPTILDTVGGNDTDPDGTIDPATVDLDPATAGIQTTFANSDGTYDVDALGNVTFTPAATLTGNPSPITYTVNDNDGNTTNTATLTVTYGLPPVSVDDSSTGNTVGTAVTINPLDNDSDPDGTLDPATVVLTGTGVSPDGKTQTVAGEGVWTVNPTTGEVTFTPETGFTADPTPVPYTVNDNDGNTSNVSNISIDYDQILDLRLTKVMSSNTDEDKSTTITINDTLTYTVSAENIGNDTIKDIVVTDSKITPNSKTCATLLPTEKCDLVGTYVVTQADVDAGKIDNIGSATTPDVENIPDVPISTPIEPIGKIALEKTGTLDKGADNTVSVGDLINYTFKVTNTGSVTLTNVIVSDPKVTVIGTPIASMAPGAVDSTSYTASYAITQIDIDAGVFENIADVTGKDPSDNDVTDKSDDPQDPTDTDTTGNGNPDDPTITPLDVAGSIALEKTGTLDLGSDEIATVGDVINYAFKVTNTGKVTLTNVIVTDPKVTVSGGPIATMAPNAVDSTTFSATYSLTQADIDAGVFENIADVTAKDPSDNDVTDKSDDPQDPTDTDTTGNGNPDDPTKTIITAPGVVAGTVYEDSNGNGTQDAGEPGIANVIVTVTDKNGKTYELKTDGNGGSTQTEGTDSTTVTVPVGGIGSDVDGYKPPENAGTVSGVVYQDTNGNGSQDSGEPGIPGATVTITDTNGGTQTLTTDENGAYEATVPAGDTTINIDESTLPGGSTQTEGTNVTIVTVPEGGTATDIDGYQPPADSGEVIGIIYEDTNGNGAQDVGEPGIPGIQVTITDVDGNVQTVTTDENGTYGATVPAGDTTIDIVEKTLPGDSTQTEGTDVTVVTVPVNGTATDRDGYQPPLNKGTVLGVVYEDTNGNGTQDKDEPGIPEVNVTITDSDGNIQTLITDEEGKYSTEVPAGTTLIDIEQSDIDPTFIRTEGTDPTTVTVPTGGTATDVDGFAPTPKQPPVAENDEKRDQTVGDAVTVKTVLNDSDPEDDLDPKTVLIVDPKGQPVTTLTVPDEGVWTVDPETGDITFTPEETFYGDPTPITYTVKDTTGLESNPATVTIDYKEAYATLEGVVWFDAVKDREIDPNETKLPEWSVIVKDPEGNEVARTKTDSQGNYIFEKLPVGVEYTVEILNANGVLMRIENPGSLNPGEVKTYELPVDPSGVFYDSITREPVEGVVLEVVNSSGTRVDPSCLLAPSQQDQTTGSDGFYRFDRAPGSPHATCAAGEILGIRIKSTPAEYITGFSTQIPPQTTVFDTDSNPANCTVDAIPGGSFCEVQAQPVAPQGNQSTVYFTQFVLVGGDTDVINNHIPLDSVATRPVINSDSILLSKSVNKKQISVGDQLYYTVRAENTTVAALDIDIRDDLPSGFKFTANSVKLTRAGADGNFGTADDVTATVSATGYNPVRFGAITVQAAEKVQIGYLLKVGTGAPQGNAVNTAQAFAAGSTTDVASNVATAQVVVVADAVLDDATLIGKVFHDRDGDGYQDDAKGNGYNSPQCIRVPDTGASQIKITTKEGSVISVDRKGQLSESHTGMKAKGLTGQELHISTRRVGKATDVMITNYGINEEGIPGVRLATVTGLLIETDGYGRYHLPDVDGGRRGEGKNFILKVDAVTLPDGSTFTTENPRVLRMTGSALNKINFGVKLPAQQVPERRVQHGAEYRTETRTQTQTREVPVYQSVDVNMGSIFFDKDKHHIRADQRGVMDDIAKKITQYGRGHITIDAFTDARHNAQYNIALAKRRANTVRGELQKRLGSKLMHHVKVEVDKRAYTEVPHNDPRAIDYDASFTD